MNCVAGHAATPELNFHRIVASAASSRRIVLGAHNDETAMIELGYSSVANELVAVSFEVNGVAVRPGPVRTQSAEDERSEPVAVKPVTGRDDVNRRVQRSVVDDGAALLLAPGKIAVHPYIDRAAPRSQKVSDADAFGEGDVIVKEVAVNN